MIIYRSLLNCISYAAALYRTALKVVKYVKNIRGMLTRFLQQKTNGIEEQTALQSG